MDIIFSEAPDAVVFDSKEGFKQLGRGITLFVDDGAHAIENGEVKDVELNGCVLMQQKLHTGYGDNTYMAYYFLGESWSGEVWKLWMCHNEQFYLDFEAKKIKTTLDRSQVVQLLRGRSFKEFIAQVTEAEREREIEALRADALVGKRFLQYVDELIAVNEQAGAGSRRKLREILLALKA